MAGTTIVLTTAKPGAGKSYRRCAGAIPEILDEGFERHISNFPVRFEDNEDGEGMASACARLVRIREEEEDGKVTFRPMSADEAPQRILAIPPEVLERWREHQPGSTQAGDGPWNYFVGETGELLNRAHVAIDEAQLYIPKTGCQAAKKQAWAGWLSEIRHTGARIEFITQDPVLLADEISKLAGIKIEIFTRDDEWISFLGCHFRAIRYFLCKLWGKRFVVSAEVESSASTSGKWDEVRRFGFVINGALFGRYNSHSANRHGIAGKEVDEPWQRYGWLGLIAWFWRTYFWYQLRNVLFVAFLAWMAFFGGVKTAVAVFTAVPQFVMRSLTKSAEPEPAQVVPPPAKGSSPPLAASSVSSASRSDAEGNVRGRAGEPQLKVVGVTPRAVFFAGLGWFEVGEVVHGDELDGPRLESIDWRRSRCSLSDGRVLRLFVAAGAPEASSGVPGGVRVGGGSGPGSGSAGAESDGAVGDVDSGGNRGPRLGSVVGSGAFGNDHLRGVSRAP